MEKRLVKKIQTHEVDLKNNIKKWFEDNKTKVSFNVDGSDNFSEFLQFMYDFPGLEFNKDDFQKRKRIKNIVPHYERCIAKRANGEQCTRRKKDDNCYCGTHIKGTPHGILDNETVVPNNITKIEVWVQEIMGINYYIDSNNNVYKAEDIIANKNNPTVLAKWILENGVYKIPAFNI